MPGITPVVGQPGIQTGKTVTYGQIFYAPESVLYIPGGGVLDASCQDFLNPTNVLCLRAGLAVGRITATKKWSPCWIGTIPNALGGASTSLTVSPLQAAEIVRRCGSSGTFALIGGPFPNAPLAQVREQIVTYSAVNLTTGVITITATGAGAVSAVNQIDNLDFVDSTGSGTFTITIEGITTGAITYSSTAATLFANINTQLNATFGTSAIVASGASLAAIILTFSGTGYAARPIVGLPIVTLLPGATGFTSTPSVNTLGVVAVAAQGGDFCAGSLIGVGDGSEIPVSVVPDGSGILMVTGNTLPVDFPQIAYQAILWSTQLLPSWPTDTGIQAWIRNAMNPPGGPLFRFSDQLNMTGT